MNPIQTPSTVVVPAGRFCPRCGGPLGGFGPEGLCGACLFDSGLAMDEPAVELDLLAAGSRKFGDYELLEEIARGGMGVIFKARHLSLNRIVAVKMILRGEFASVGELARFRAEAETAARLQHPNIVAIHEVGECEGQPYFSMDYVEGQNLAQLVGNTPLPAARAAKYLKTIAEAVQYAHEHGVLHRDLKPSNVLVDARDQPRVTDFGLAKQLDSQLSTNNLHLTQTGQVLGSPSFMPPEQAAGKNDAISPASDVYSLGAMLYHALTGRPPFVAESVPATLRLVSESEAVSPRLLNASVPRELETICLKCLQKEPQRRYATAQELTEELGRFLQDEPIHAQPIAPAEKVWRWCRRNRPLAITGTTVLALLLAVAIGSPIAALRINRERLQAEIARRQAQADEKKAQTEAAKSLQVANFLQEMLKGVGPSVALGRDTTMLREILDKTAGRMSKDLTNQPEVEIELCATLADVYYELGLYQQAEVLARDNLRLSQLLHGESSPVVAKALLQLGRIMSRLRRYSEAVKFDYEAVAMFKQFYGEEHPVVADALSYLAMDTGSEDFIREALAMQRKLLGSECKEVVHTLKEMAFLLREKHKLAEAEDALREALGIQTRLLGLENPSLADVMGELSRVLLEQGKLSEAETMRRDALVMRRRFLGNEHPQIAFSIARLADVLVREGRLAEAAPLYQEALMIYRKLGNVDEANVLKALALLLGRQGNYADARVLLREAAEGRDARFLNYLAWFLATSEDAQLRDGTNAVLFAEKMMAQTGRTNFLYLDTLAATYAETGDFVKAVSVQKEAIGLLQDGKMKGQFVLRLKLYESNTPCREP